MGSAVSVDEAAGLCRVFGLVATVAPSAPRPSLHATAARRRVSQARSKGSLLLFLVSLPLAVVTRAADDAEKLVLPRGAAPDDLAAYAPLVDATGAQRFRCLRSSSAAPDLPYAAVNDDFCDCADGSDEPGTGACAGQKETLFYCPSEQSQPLYVYASHVNDGVCDCCDGSDEWRFRSTPCPNTCAAEGRALRKELDRREAELRSGLKQREALVDAARAERTKLRQELESLKATLPGLEAVEQSTKATLEEAQKALDEERRQQEALRNRSANSSAAAAGTVDGAVEAPGQSTSAAGSDAAIADDNEAVKSAAGGAASGTGEGAGKEAGTADGSVVSEYAKWMEGADEALGDGQLQKAGARLTPAQAVEDDVDDEELGAPASLWTRFREKLSVGWQALFGKAKTKAERDLDAAQAAHKEAKSKVSDSRQRTEDLEAKVGTSGEEVSAISEEDRLAYSSLEGKCISKKFSDYKYEACFFKDAKQDSMNIGRWSRWEAPNVALFDDGNWCPGGPARSLRVRFVCGRHEELVDVAEPSRCAYEATLSHPVACSMDALKALERSRGPRRPTDEL